MAQLSSYQGRNSVAVTENKTLAAADQGIVQSVTADATITLPATAADLTFTIRNASEVGGVTVNVSPAAADQLIGNGFTPADNKDAINAGEFGEEITVVGNGTTGYHITEVVGEWTREA